MIKNIANLLMNSNLGLDRKEKRNNTNAVILGANANGLGHVRALGAAGIYTYVVCSGADYLNLARFSKYCTPLFVLENNPNYEYELCSKLIELAKSTDVKLVLFATSDYFVNFISSHRTVFEEYFYFNIPEKNALEIIINKSQTDSFARSSGVRSPKTIRMSSSDTIESVSHSLSFPCIVKPQDSYSLPFPGKNKIINNKNELSSFFNNYKDLKEHIIIQEIIPGGDKNIFQCTAYIGNRTPAQFFTMQKIHQRPPGYGVATLGRSVTVPELVEETRKLLANLKYTGFASVEFKKSDHDFQYYIIEINPRLPWYNSLFLSCGVNFPYLAYLDLTSEQIDSFLFTDQRDNVYWLHLRDELSGLAQKWKSIIPMNLLEDLNYILKARSFAYFDKHDLKPFLMSNIELLCAIKRKVFF